MNFYELDDLDILENKTRLYALNMIEELLGKDKDFQEYWHFRMDVAALVLNNLPACYVVNDMEHLPLFDKMSEAEIKDVILESAKLVRQNPHHMIKRKKDD